MIFLYISIDIQLLASNQYCFQLLIVSNQYTYQHPINTPSRCRSVQLLASDHCNFRLPINIAPFTSLLVTLLQ